MELFILPMLVLLGVGLMLVDTPSQASGSMDDQDDAQTPDDDPGPNAAFGNSNDFFAGAEGNQNLFLQGGNDAATGGPGNDRIFLGDGHDTTTDLSRNIGTSFDQLGDDFIRGGRGNDYLVDTMGSNTIHGDQGADRIVGIDHADDRGTGDQLFGGFGADLIDGDSGDTLTGGGNAPATSDGIAGDRFRINVVDGGKPAVITDLEGGETITIRDQNGTPVSLESLSAAVAENGTDLRVLLDGDVVLVLQGVAARGVTDISPEVFKNPSDQYLFGTDESDTIEIPDGVTAVFTKDGSDTITFADPSADATQDRDMRINSGRGNDSIVSGFGDDTLIGNLGRDVIDGGGGVDQIDGGFGADTIRALDAIDGQADEIIGGAGEDIIYADDGDIVTGGLDADTFHGEFATADDGAITITDYDPAHEELHATIVGPSGGAIPAAVTVTQNGADVEIRYGTRILFVLQGISATDVDTSKITATERYP